MKDIRNKPTNLEAFIRQETSKGRYTFSTQDVVKQLGKSEIAVRASIRRLRAKKIIATPVQGFHVIIPPEFESIGCLPAEQFINELMNHWQQPYYIGLLSAAQIHGAAHQAPQELQVITSRNHKTIRCGKVRMRFVASQNIALAFTSKIKTARGLTDISIPEMTMVDLMYHSKPSGGLQHIVTVLGELLEFIDEDKLIKVLQKYPVEIVTVQRLGYILEIVLGQNKLGNLIHRKMKNCLSSFQRLDPSVSKKGATVNDKWRLLINESLEAEL